MFGPDFDEKQRLFLRRDLHSVATGNSVRGQTCEATTHLTQQPLRKYTF